MLDFLFINSFLYLFSESIVGYKTGSCLLKRSSCFLVDIVLLRPMFIALIEVKKMVSINKRCFCLLGATFPSSSNCHISSSQVCVQKFGKQGRVR